MIQTTQNIAIYNDQQLDLWSDIIVSFEYERYAYNTSTTGGFAVVFFNSIVDLPRGGGPEYSLGYTSNTRAEYCSKGGYSGLQAAFLGIGFDNKGLFGAEIDGHNGIPLSELNQVPTITVRGGVAEDYNVLNTFNLNGLSAYSNASTFTIDQSASSTGTIFKRSVRIILKNNATNLLVQLKNNPDTEQFDTVIDMQLPEKARTALRVALTNTSSNNITKFNVLNFNTAGFPGVTSTQKLDQCSDVIVQKSFGLKNSELCAGNEYVTTSLPNKVVTYTTDTVKYNLKNIIYTGSGIKITGSSGDYVVGIYENKPLVAVYKYLGEKLAKNFLITTPDNGIPTWADIDMNTGTLALMTRSVSGVVYVYNYTSESMDQVKIGKFNLFQTIPYSPAVHGDSGFQDKLKISGKNLIITGGNEKVHTYRKDISTLWTYGQKLSATIAANFITGFGEEIAVSGDHLLVGAPQSQKLAIPEPTQGEVYHYAYSTIENKWNLVMALGSFYGLNTPLGTFGSTIAFEDDTCVVGSPGEEYRIDENNSIINVGRIHLFRKSAGGVFSQGASISPEDNYIEANSFYGTKVAIYDGYVFVLSPFTEFYKKSYITAYNLDCKFKLPPPQINIPACALITFDNRAFILDSITGTYMLSYSCRIGGDNF